MTISEVNERIFRDAIKDLAEYMAGTREIFSQVSEGLDKQEKQLEELSKKLDLLTAEDTLGP